MTGLRYVRARTCRRSRPAYSRPPGRKSNMLIKIGFELVFDLPAPVPMLLMLHVHPEKLSVLRRPEQLIVEPEVPVRHYVDGFGNHAARISAPAGKLRL